MRKPKTSTGTVSGTGCIPVDRPLEALEPSSCCDTAEVFEDDRDRGDEACDQLVELLLL